MMKHVCLSSLAVMLLSPAAALDFGGYACEQSCDRQVEGFRWAKAQSIKAADRCPSDQGEAFQQGCKTFVADPDRGTDVDDSGKDIKVTPAAKEEEND